MKWGTWHKWVISFLSYDKKKCKQSDLDTQFMYEAKGGCLHQSWGGAWGDVLAPRLQGLDAFSSYLNTICLFVLAIVYRNAGSLVLIKYGVWRDSSETSIVEQFLEYFTFVYSFNLLSKILGQITRAVIFNCWYVDLNCEAVFYKLYNGIELYN